MTLAAATICVVVCPNVAWKTLPQLRARAGPEARAAVDHAGLVDRLRCGVEEPLGHQHEDRDRHRDGYFNDIRRTQIYITDEQAACIRQIARERKVSQA